MGVAELSPSEAATPVRKERSLWAESFYRLRKNRIALASLIFIILLTFDFSIQPVLAPGTGQSLNCYNCQACVGVCPVKMVDGDPFPMIMVLEARLGNFERVAELAEYCVGCGKCAAKCPIGNSGPLIASSCYVLWRDQMRRKEKEQQRMLREVPSAGTGKEGHEA